jgi:uncharacterized delta-60 repeat protein
MKTQAFFLMSLIYFAGFSQDGSPDFSFGNNGIVETELGGEGDSVHAVTQSASGRIVIVGDYYDFNNNTHNGFIIAYQEDGALDTTFGNNGILLSNLQSNEYPYDDVKIQQDEKILTKRNFNSHTTITRFLSNGSLDIDFGVNGNLIPFYSGGSFKSYILTQDDKFLVSGTQVINNIQQIILKRYLTNGTIDSSFGNNGMINYAFGNESSQGGSIQLMQNQSFILSAEVVDNNVTSQNMIRFLEDGSLDNSFGTNGITEIPIGEEFGCAPLLFMDGSILTRCSYYDPQPNLYNKTTLKLDANGDLDTSFGNGGYVDFYFGDIIQANNRILDIDSYTDWEGGIDISVHRYYENGTLDPSFQYVTNYAELWTVNMNLQNSGKILIAGSSVWYNGPTKVVLQQYNNDPLGIPEFNSEKFIVLPNPSEGIFTISSAKNLDSEIHFQILDVTARIIETGVLTEGSTQINLSEAKSGMYFLITGNSTLRLMKQ